MKSAVYKSLAVSGIALSGMFFGRQDVWIWLPALITIVSLFLMHILDRQIPLVPRYKSARDHVQDTSSWQYRFALIVFIIMFFGVFYTIIRLVLLLLATA